MHRYLLLPLALLIALAGMATAVHAQDVTLVEDGQARAAIYVVGPLDEAMTTDDAWRRTNPSTPEQYRAMAVQEINYHIEQMTGTRLEVVTTEDSDTIPTPAIVLGDPAIELGAEPTETTENDQGFRLLVQDGRVLIGGQSEMAMLHGVYALLREVGCDWVMPGEIGESIPEQQTVSVPGDLDRAEAPDFLNRRLWYRGYPNRQPEEFERFTLWLIRHQGLGGLPPRAGGGGHAWDQFIRRHQEEFDADPTMLALRRMPDGTLQRSGPQLESTHPRVIELFVQEIKTKYESEIAAGNWTAESEAAFPIGPADGLGYSLSAEAMLAGSGRIDPVVGELDRTDELILMGNSILEEVHKEYPNAYVGFYSYSTHADYPARYHPNPNITQIFAPINFSRFHSMLSPKSKTQAYYRDVIAQWGRLSQEQGNPLVYRGYSWNLAENMLPYTKVRIWGEELPFYHEMGFLGANVEGTKSWSVLAPSDYVFMRMAWDSSQDWRELLRDFCEAAYGEGADAMEQYHLALIDRQENAGQEAGSYHAFHLLFDDEWVAEARALIEEALAAADTDADRERIGHVEHNLKALELYLDYHAATRRFDFAAAQEGYQAMAAHWQAGYDENPDLVSNEVPQYLTRFIERFVNTAAEYSSEPYRVVHEIPDELKTMLDPYEVGHRMNFHSPHIVDDHFQTTQTFGSTWDAQGLAGMRDGAVWYREHFTLPEDARGEPIGLFIGGAEDEARVWINGELIGSARSFSMPFLYDLTDGIDYEGENVLAIQVIRNSKANEIGLGGLIRPSFIFAGPQLEERSPQTPELRRVLPGGELGEIEQ